MSVEQEVANLTTATTNLLDAVNVSKLTLDQAVAEAASAAITAGLKYVDEPTGRAAVEDGQTFMVQGSGYTAAYEYRRTSASASTLIASYPSAKIDSLTVNSGKHFPLRATTRAGLLSDESTLFSNLILSVKVEGIPLNKYVGIKYQKNNSAASGSYAYGWTITEHERSNYATTDADAVTIHVHTDPAPDINRFGGVQTILITPTQRPDMRIEIVIDAAQLPPEGTPIDSNSSNTRPGWSWIVDESCYQFRAKVVESDELSINAWKIFPFVSYAHANIPAVANPSQAVASWLFPILDFRVQNADPLYFYLVSAIYAPGNTSFPCRWIIQKQLREGFGTDEPNNSTNNVRIIHFSDPMPLYEAGTGKQSIVLSKDGFQEKFYVTIDTDHIPSTGQYLATTNAQDGFTFIIHPSKYTFPERSATPSVAWSYEGVKWEYAASSKSVTMIYRSGNELRRETFGPKGVNGIPDIKAVHKAPLGDPDTAVWSQILEASAGGDMATPPICNFAVNNGDGETDLTYTGGNHADTGGATGNPTGRNTLFSFMPDGVPVTEDAAGVANSLEIVSFNRVQAANTMSLGRETMEQQCSYQFKNGSLTTKVKWVALEEVKVVTDNGPQVITSGFQAGTFQYYGKSNARATFTSVTDSGAKPSFPDVWAVSYKDATNGELIVWMDRAFEVGDGRYVGAARPLIRGGGASNTKFYHAAVSIPDTEVILSAGQSYQWRGGYIYRSVQPVVAGFDAVLPIIGDSERTRTVRDNGTDV